MNWQTKKILPKAKVICIHPNKRLTLTPKISQGCVKKDKPFNWRWAIVKLIPEINKQKVFTNGNCQGLITSIITGGQIPPIWAEGTKLAWKKAQKKPKKNIISEIINNNIPTNKPRRT